MKLTHLQNFGLFLYHLPLEPLGDSANRTHCPFVGQSFVSGPQDTGYQSGASEIYSRYLSPCLKVSIGNLLLFLLTAVCIFLLLHTSGNFLLCVRLWEWYLRGSRVFLSSFKRR